MQIDQTWDFLHLAYDRYIFLFKRHEGDLVQGYLLFAF